MLNRQGFLKKDLDQAVRLYRWFNHYVDRAKTLMAEGQFFEARRELERTIKIARSLDTLKDEKWAHDLNQAIAQQKQINDQQGIVEKILRSRK